MMTSDAKEVAAPDNKEALASREIVRKCWDDLISLPKKSLSLPELHASAEKIVQYCRAVTGDVGIEWLKAQVEDGERFASSALVADPGSLECKRLHAALTGARAGLTYPLGRSPRDLNLMAF